MSVQKGQPSQPKHDSKHNEPADDRWLGDLQNDLGAMSLSSERIPTHSGGEMGCLDSSTPDNKHSHHKHDEVGI